MLIGSCLRDTVNPSQIHGSEIWNDVRKKEREINPTTFYLMLSKTSILT